MHRRLRSDLTFAQNQDGAAVLDLRAGTITTLNETGAVACDFRADSLRSPNIHIYPKLEALRSSC